MRYFILLTCVVPLMLGCHRDPKSGHGFTLPDGDVDRGQALFQEMHCTACHTVEGVKFESAEPGAEKMVALGGDLPYTKTYGNLVTSIINPSHRIPARYSKEEFQDEDGKSKMRLYNDEMTITQLCDLVTFLQKRYKLKPIQPTHYHPYY